MPLANPKKVLKNQISKGKNTYGKRSLYQILFQLRDGQNCQGVVLIMRIMRFPELPFVNNYIGLTFLMEPMYHGYNQDVLENKQSDYVVIVKYSL